MKQVGKSETREEREARLDREFWEIVWEPFPPSKPKVEVVSIPVRAADAALIRTTGERLRLMAPRDDGPTAMIKPVGPIALASGVVGEIGDG